MHAVTRRTAAWAANGQRIRSVSTDATTPTLAKPEPKEAAKPRIVSSLGGISIPSREDILKANGRKKLNIASDDTRGYRPDLNYLSKFTSASLANRLASHRLQTAPKTERTASPAAPSRSAAEAVPAPPRVQRPDPTIEARRAARLAREERLAEKKVRWNAPKSARDDQLDAAASLAEGAAVPNSRLNPSGPSGDQRKRGTPGKGPKRNAAGPRSPTPRPSVKIPSATSQQSTDEMAAIEKGLKEVEQEVVEEEDTDAELPALYGAGTISADLTDIFAPSSSTRLEKAAAFSRQALPTSQGVKEWALKTFGGDYSQYATENVEDYSKPVGELGPVRYAQLTLSHRRDVNLKQRQVALAVVGSSTGGSSSHVDRAS
ncbi:hypothetical protein BDQ12DRAFT_719896 [Crucibulum laeve]|uniref:Uncharacterized protein n=1 Tax=Crucibulum laeve TaxID=68775 RepID=A0A5C3M9C1_9AGAR|nr:hypothetical protein BDQ12DRAFT_719896 [Crucibulum laeve]